MSGSARLGTLRLSFVIPATVMVSTVVGAALALALSSRLSLGHAFESAELTMATQLSRYQYVIDTATRRGDSEFVEHVIASIGGDRRIVAASIVSPDDTVVASSRLAEVGHRVESLAWSGGARAAVAQARRRRGPVLQRDAFTSWGAIALTEGPADRPRVLLLASDVEPQWAALMHNARFAIAFFALLMLVTAAFATLVFQRAILRRTKPILDAANAFAKGDLAARSGVTTKDEIGAMATVFDAMAEELAQRQRVIVEAEQRYRVMFEQATDAMFIPNVEGAFLDANPAAQALVGYSRDELRSLGLRGLIAPEELKERPLRIDLLLERGSMTLNRTLVSKSGLRIHVELTATVLSDGRLFAIARDLRPRLEADRLRAHAAANERLALLGNLAAGIGHELNNPLTWMLDSLGRAASGLPEGPLRDLLSEAKGGAERIAAIVADLRLFSHDGGDEPADVSLEKVTKTALNLLGPSARERLTVHVEAGGVPLVRAGERRLCEVLVNLVQNAAHAMPQGRSAAQNELRITAAKQADGRVTLEVRDNAGGIAPEVLPRIFEPYFTTRPDGVGAGLGLALSREFLTRMGATMEVTSSVGVGTTFTITFVAASPPVAAQPVSQAERGARRVLVVDDEPLVAKVTVRMLNGDDVKVAPGPVQALELCRAADFDVVLCDLSMPDGGGPRLFADLTALRPALARRIIFVTGGAATDEVAGFLAKTRAPVLHKPFDRAGLHAAIDAVLKQATGPA